jgi:hypothetical protein
MTDPRCKLCRDERWVCEEHLDQPMGHDDCKGAGVPCPDCIPAGGPDEPPAPRRGFTTSLASRRAQGIYACPNPQAVLPSNNYQARHGDGGHYAKRVDDDGRPSGRPFYF